MVGPILQLKDELFQTFRQRRSIVSVQEYETDKASLERMLKDFESDFAKSGQVLPPRLLQTMHAHASEHDRTSRCGISIHAGSAVERHASVLFAMA